MMTKNRNVINDYWVDRVSQLEKSNFMSNESFIKFLHSQYNATLSDLDKEIYNLLARIAEDNKTSLSEAKRLLNSGELKGFKMGLEKFISDSRNAENLSKDVMRELNNASHAVRISKLQAMELQVKSQVDRLLNFEQKEVFNHLGEQYKDSYYRMIYDLQNVTGYKHIQKISDKKLDLILNKPWAADEKNFSDRIWGRRDKLINELHTELTQGLIRGDSPDKIVKKISNKFDISKRNAYRLVQTESNFITSISQHNSFTEMGVDEFENVATLDSVTSEICRDMDGTHFKESERQIGVNSPPFHPNCRTITVPYFDDDIQRALEDTRMARDPKTGKSVRVEGNLKYHDWYNKYVA